MARYDLDELRLEIAALSDEMGIPFTEKEFRDMTYWGEDRLLERAAFYEDLIAWEYEQAQEIEEADDEGEQERREILADFGYEDFEPDYGQEWEIEIVTEIDS